MPIIPASWTGYNTVNAIGLGGGGSGGSTSFAYAKSLNTTITELDTFVDLIGVSSESIGREFSLDLISGTAQLFWKQLDGSYILIFKDDFTFGNIFVDYTLGQLGLTVKCSEITELFLVVRWDKDIEFNVYGVTNGDELMINPQVRLLLPTGTNYPGSENSMAYDADATTYEANLTKLKNSDSGIAGFKLFDIYSFYPGHSIDFEVIVDPSYSSLYGGIIALQLLDPLSVAQAAMDVAADIVNIETNNIAGLFVGNLTRNAQYRLLESNGFVSVDPDFSRHVGRFAAQNTTNNNAFDTAIIKSYTPNVNPLLGGTFTLTGDF